MPCAAQQSTTDKQEGGREMDSMFGESMDRQIDSLCLNCRAGERLLRECGPATRLGALLLLQDAREAGEGAGAVGGLFFEPLTWHSLTECDMQFVQGFPTWQTHPQSLRPDITVTIDSYWRARTGLLVRTLSATRRILSVWVTASRDRLGSADNY
jgi:hypothetical protein